LKDEIVNKKITQKDQKSNRVIKRMRIKIETKNKLEVIYKLFIEGWNWKEKQTWIKGKKSKE